MSNEKYYEPRQNANVPAAKQLQPPGGPVYDIEHGETPAMPDDSCGARTDEKPVTNPQRLLLAGAFAIAFFFQLYAFGAESDVGFMARYASFWAAYIVVFHLLCRDKVKKAPMAAPFAVTAVLLCCAAVAQAYIDDQMRWINVVILPCILMFHAQLVANPLPAGRESGYLALFFYGFFVQPFKYIGKFFNAAGSLFRKDGRMVWLGVLIAVPVAGMVLALLSSADAVVSSMLGRLFSDSRLQRLFFRLLVLFVFAVLFYSFLYGAKWGRREAAPTRTIVLWPAIAPRVVLGALIAIYAFFTAIQFVYLFGGRGLPDDLTYAAYAREGFSQLIWVAAINLAVFAACLCRVREDAIMRGMLVALLAATGVILASAFTRLGLYIGAYGLTFKRVQAFWMLGYISMIIALCCVRLFKSKLPLLRASAFILLGWYLVLNGFNAFAITGGLYGLYGL
ncbi:MAG: DUF4173 domain-containing protein [Clostridiales bacterium]|jgi:hypothetical protein|nr:DUF4173 domain-containing protein [Clostridiales bacterium]